MGGASVKVRVGDLIHYQFGRSDIFGVVIEKYIASRWAAPHSDYMFTIKILESDCTAGHWDIYEVDIVTDKLKVLQPVKSSTSK